MGIIFNKIIANLVSIGFQKLAECYNWPKKYYHIQKGASLVWPKLVWPNARLAETHLAESPFGRRDPTGRKMAENFTKMD
jgi:hypothetical protein